MSVFNFMAIHQIYLGGISDWTEVVHRPTQRWTAASVAKKHPHDVMSQTPKGASSVSFPYNFWNASQWTMKKTWWCLWCCVCVCGFVESTLGGNLAKLSFTTCPGEMTVIRDVSTVKLCVHEVTWAAMWWESTWSWKLQTFKSFNLYFLFLKGSFF